MGDCGLVLAVLLGWVVGKWVMVESCGGGCVGGDGLLGGWVMVAVVMAVGGLVVEVVAVGGRWWWLQG